MSEKLHFYTVFCRKEVDHTMKMTLLMSYAHVLSLISAAGILAMSLKLRAADEQRIALLVIRVLAIIVMAAMALASAADYI